MWYETRVNHLTIPVHFSYYLDDEACNREAFTSSLEENNFADDIGLPRHTKEQMQEKIHKCKEEKERFENE